MIFKKISHSLSEFLTVKCHLQLLTVSVSHWIIDTLIHSSDRPSQIQSEPLIVSVSTNARHFQFRDIDQGSVSKKCGSEPFSVKLVSCDWSG